MNGVVNLSNDTDTVGKNINKTDSRLLSNVDNNDPSREWSKNSSSMDSDDDDQNDENLVRGSSCPTTVGASVIKRWNIYRRDYCGFICQVISPLILIFFGLLLYTAPSTLTQSPEKFLGTSLYPN